MFTAHVHSHEVYDRGGGPLFAGIGKRQRPSSATAMVPDTRLRDKRFGKVNNRLSLENPCVPSFSDAEKRNGSHQAPKIAKKRCFWGVIQLSLPLNPKTLDHSAPSNWITSRTSFAVLIGIRATSLLLFSAFFPVQ